VVGKNHKVDKESKGDADSHEGVVLTYGEDQHSQLPRDVLHEEEPHISAADEEIHEGIDFLGPPFNKEDREVGIENRVARHCREWLSLLVLKFDTLVLKGTVLHWLSTYTTKFESI
jgi:hypothetical protein